MEQDNQNFHTTKMKKEQIITILKNRKCRITQQRLMLLDIILEENCSCCKEIYYQAVKKDKNIGTATVYRMISTLEDIGAISRKNMYKISCDHDCGNVDCDTGLCNNQECGQKRVCKIRLDDETEVQLSAKDWNQVIEQGLKQCGFLSQQKILSVEFIQCGCN